MTPAEPVPNERRETPLSGDHDRWDTDPRGDLSRKFLDHDLKQCR
jgi:hypothetical protein